MLKGCVEIRVRMSVRDQVCDVTRPARLGQDEIVHRELEMIARRVDAAYQHLVSQHEAAHDFRAVDAERPVASRDPGDGVHAVHGQHVEKIEFKGRDSRRFDNHVERAAERVFLGGVVVTVLLATTLRTLRQIRDLRSRSRTERLEREVADMKAKASMLRTRTPTEPVHHETTPASLADVAPPIDPDEE